MATTTASPTTAPTRGVQRVAVDEVQLRRVPDLGQQQHRREHQRAGDRGGRERGSVASSAHAASSATTTTPALGRGPVSAAIAVTRGRLDHRSRHDHLPSGDMSSAKLAIACGFCALVLSACGATNNPEAGAISPTATTAGRAKLDDPRTMHVECLQQAKIPVTEVGTLVAADQRSGRPEGSVRSNPRRGAVAADRLAGAGRRGDRERAAVSRAGVGQRADDDRELPRPGSQGLAYTLGTPCSRPESPSREGL